MKVILRSDLDGLGKRGDIVDVADGHARNYLLPKGLALMATAGCRRPGRQDAPVARPARRQRPRGAPRPSPPRWCPRSSRSPPRPGPRASCSARSPPPTSSTPSSEQTGIELDRKTVARRADQDARRAHRDGQAALRRVVPDHVRGRPGLTVASVRRRRRRTRPDASRPLLCPPSQGVHMLLTPRPQDSQRLCP